MRAILRAVAVTGLLLAAQGGWREAVPQAIPAREQPDLVVFVRAGCPHCEAAKEYLADLQGRRPDLRVEIHDVGRDPAALARLREIAAREGVQVVAVPAFQVRGELLVGFESPETTGRRIETLLARSLPSDGVGVPGGCPIDAPEPCAEDAPASAGVVDHPVVGRVSLEKLGLPLFTIVLGLLDGFNPCAMWVLVFLLSLLVNLRDRARMFLIGGVFVLMSGVVYFAFMAAWLNLFLLIGVSRAVQVGLGLLAGGVGALNVKDAVAPGRGVSLRIPESARPGIYARARRILRAENLAGALGGVVVLAVLVNLVEILCTAGLPAIYTQVLTLQQLPTAQYYGYLALYNVAYMLDDGLLLTIAVATLSHRRLQESEGRWLKLLSGSIMLVLGALLLFRPEWLSP